MSDHTVPRATLKAARFIAGLDSRGLPQPIAQKARCCILYGFGIGLLCLDQQTARVAEQALLDIDGEPGRRGGATALGTGARVPVSSAVFANSVLLHSRCQEDTSGTAHLGVVVLSVALALVEAGLASPSDLLAGVVAGYEVGGTLEAALGRDTMASGLRASALYGTLAAAATAARMLRLDAARIDAALANAAGMTGGTLQSIPEGSDEWRYQVGMSARTGLVAAFLARQGSVSAGYSIEGAQGFALGYGRRAVALDELGFGERWRLPDVTFKPYPVCAHNQTVGLVGAQLHAQGVAPERIASLRLKVNPYVVPGMLECGPFERVAETLMSSYFCCASASIHGTVSMAQLASFDDARVAALIQRMEIELDPALPFPSALIDLKLDDGSSLSFEERRTFADFSLGRGEVEAQLRRLAIEEGVPVQAVALLDAFAFGALDGPPAAVAEAFALARARQPAGRSESSTLERA